MTFKAVLKVNVCLRIFAKIARNKEFANIDFCNIKKTGSLIGILIFPPVIWKVCELGDSFLHWQC